MQVPVGVVPGLGSAMMPGVADQYAQQVACNGKYHPLLSTAIIHKHLSLQAVCMRTT